MINVVSGIKSTGRICSDIAKRLIEMNHEVTIAYGREEVPMETRSYSLRIGTDFDNCKHLLKTRLLDAHGFGSIRVTKNFIKWIEDYNPDVIHLHNLHGYYINVQLLFEYFKKKEIPIIWTLHDMWPFTGHSAYCEDCSRYIDGCFRCPKKKAYPKSYIDLSSLNWNLKKQIFTGLPNVTIVTPSNWLNKKVEASFLGKYNLLVIHNGVDTNIFKPLKTKIKEKYNIGNCQLVMGIAAVWDERKGLNDIISISKHLRENYKFIVVGVSDKQIRKLPDTVIGLRRTNSTTELAEIYSSADVFINPTYMDNYPTTNIESIACGTPVISYDTGGSGESAKLFGEIVKKGDYIGLEKSIIRLCEKKKEFHESIRYNISLEKMVNEYLNLYYDVCGIGLSNCRKIIV